MREFCHNIQPYMQPKPNKNPGGDCFACTLTATLHHLFPENKPDFDTVWNYFIQKYYMSEEKGLSNTWPGMKKAISGAYADGYYTDNEFDIVMPTFNSNIHSHVFYESNMSSEYTRRLEGWLRSGWVALAEIHYNGGGPRSSWNSQFNDGDHFIILDGIREVWEKIDNPNVPGNARTLSFYIHVVCSAKGAYWISTRELMKNYGAGGWLLVRRSDRD